MQTPKRLIRNLSAGLLAISLAGIYAASLAPGLTWANSGADGGDLIAAAASGGVAHPSGYPLYLLLARLFQFLPFGSLAFRTNLMSALLTVCAAVLVQALVRRSLSALNSRHAWLAGLVSGAAFGLAPLVWSQAVITEVYALQALLVALILFIVTTPTSNRFTPARRAGWLGLCFGLGMGNQLTTLLLLPVVLAPAFRRTAAAPAAQRAWMGWQANGAALLRIWGWIGLGLLVYLSLPLRALAHPPVDWGNPTSLSGLVWLVSARLYQGRLFDLSFPSMLERLGAMAVQYLQQFGVVGLAGGLTGLLVFFKPARLYIYLLWITASASVFALVYATADAFVYLIPALLCFAVWIGMGAAGLMDALKGRGQRFAPLIGLVFLVAIGYQAWKAWPLVDAAHDQRAEAFGQAVLSLAPERAIILAQGDPAVFSLWYFQYALGQRPDLAVIAVDLLQFPWYLQTLQSTYPDLELPGPFPFPQTVIAANPGRAVCYAQYLQAAEINCLPGDLAQR